MVYKKLTSKGTLKRSRDANKYVSTPKEPQSQIFYVTVLHILTIIDTEV
jgi:hypothetical protein